jgi:hypothetical protein
MKIILKDFSRGAVTVPYSVFLRFKTVGVLHRAHPNVSRSRFSRCNAGHVIGAHQHPILSWVQQMSFGHGELICVVGLSSADTILCSATNEQRGICEKRMCVVLFRLVCTRIIRGDHPGPGPAPHLFGKKVKVGWTRIIVETLHNSLRVS